MSDRARAARFLALIPARDEAASVAGVVADLRRHCPGCEVLVVDDGSSDGTEEVVARLAVRWLRLPVNVGVGAAVRAGLRYARLLGHDTVVRIDGDGQHRADQIERLLAPIRAGQAAAVLGSRYHAGARYRSPMLRRIAQRALAHVLSRVARQRVTDPTSGFWAFGPRAVRILGEHHPTGYPEPELILFLRRNGLRMVEVATEMSPRVTGRTSLTLIRMALALARVLLALLVVPLRASVGEGRQ